MQLIVVPADWGGLEMGAGAGLGRIRARGAVIDLPPISQPRAAAAEQASAKVERKRRFLASPWILFQAVTCGRASTDYPNILPFIARDGMKRLMAEWLP